MPRVSSFAFSEDGGITAPTVCDINWAAQTVTYPGQLGLPFAEVPEVIQAIRDLANQDLADNVGETAKVIYREDGTVGAAVNCTITPGAAGSDPFVNTISPGASAFSKGKALDLCVGLETYVLGL